MPKIQINFIKGFINDELPAFQPIIEYVKKQESQVWIDQFKNILTSLMDGPEQRDSDDELYAKFLKYEMDFYEIVIDKGLAVALKVNKDSNNINLELYQICYKIVYDLACNALGINVLGINKEKKSTESSSYQKSLFSKCLRYYPRLKIELPLMDCNEAPSELWEYIGKESIVERDGNEVKIMRLLTFKRTTPHRLLSTYLAGNDFGFGSWLKKVLIKIGNKMYKGMSVPPESKDEKFDNVSDDKGRQNKLEAEMVEATEKNNLSDSELLDYTKTMLASYFAYYEILHEIMSKGRSAQYENWLLRRGFLQMILGLPHDSKKDSHLQGKWAKERDHGIHIHDTSAILACLSHDEKWNNKCEIIKMRGVNVWANGNVWTHDNNEKRPKVTQSTDDAKNSIYKTNSLIIKELGKILPGEDEQEQAIFARLLRACGVFKDGSNDRLVKSFHELVVREMVKKNDNVKLDEMTMKRLVENMDEEEAYAMREAYEILVKTSLFLFLAQDVTDDEVNAMLKIYEIDNVYDQIHKYFANPSMPKKISSEYRFCYTLLHVPGLSERTINLLKLYYINADYMKENESRKEREE